MSIDRIAQVASLLLPGGTHATGKPRASYGARNSWPLFLKLAFLRVLLALRGNFYHRFWWLRKIVLPSVSKKGGTTKGTKNTKVLG